MPGAMHWRHARCHEKETLKPKWPRKKITEAHQNISKTSNLIISYLIFHLGNNMQQSSVHKGSHVLEESGRFLQLIQVTRRQLSQVKALTEINLVSMAMHCTCEMLS